METMPSWFWIVVIDLSFFVAGLSILWYFARRVFRDEAGAERGSSRLRGRTVMRALEDRLERLLLQPPSWNQVARKLRPYGLGMLGVALGSVAVWALWTHAGSWFSDPPTPRALPPTIGAGLPFENAFSALWRAVTGPLLTLFGVLGILGAGVSILTGDGRRAPLFGAMALAPLFMSGFGNALFGGSDQPTSATVAPAQRVGSAEVVYPDDSMGTGTEEGTVEAPADAYESPAQLEAAARTASSDEPLESQELEQAPAALPVIHRHVSSHESSRFGIGDALMMYGAYKVLTHDHHAATAVNAPHHAVSQPSAAHEQVSAPKPAASASTPVRTRARAGSVYRTTRSRR